MSQYQITAIRKPDRHSTHERITHVKYNGFVHAVEDVIYFIENRIAQFYVSVGGATSWVEVVHPGVLTGRKPFIRTTRDWTGKDNLLNLPEC